MGWFKDPARHALAAKGVQTRIGRAQLDLVASGDRIPGTFLRGASYGHLAQSLGKRYLEGSEVSAEDYERAIAPLFEALASADVLVDRGDLKGAIRQLDLAEHEYASLCSQANLLSDGDAREFTQVARMISEKAITRSRIPTPKKAPTVIVQSQQPAVPQPKIDKKPGVNENESQSR